ncbi:MAG: hypothetical protein K8W52_21910, partial [Deltaproteobacteria bacterium]|nr:hypothetical protein [Deltaproteobacteria bacterium]
AELDARPATATADPWRAAAPPPPPVMPVREQVAQVAAGSARAAVPPRLPEPAPAESRLERRLRRQQELAAMLGRLDGETAEQYRARIAPMITGVLTKPRQDIEQLRKDIEAKANVTPDQRAKLDAAFGEVYDDLLKYTNGAIADGQLTPYASNVSGLLEYAGGLGTILDGANGRIGQILSPEQVKTITGSGFEWGEYLGVLAPWERLDAPPPPP